MIPQCRSRAKFCAADTFSETGAAPQRSLLRPFVYVFLLSLVIRVLWVAHATVTPIGDHYGYDRSAEHLIETGQFCQSLSDLDYRVRGSEIRAYRTPGYIGFVALLYVAFGYNWGVVGAAHAVLGALTSGLLVVLAARTISRRVGVVAGLLHALWPTSIFYVPVLAGDNLQVFLLVAGVTSLAGAHVGRWRWWLATSAGLCLGLMMLVRPSSLFIMPAWALLALYNPLQRVWRFRVLLLVLGLTGAMLLPWLVRNYRMGYGFPKFSTQAGYALWWGNNWLTNDGANPFPPRFPGDRDLSDAQQDRFFSEKALTWIRENPDRYVDLCAVRLVRVLGTQPDVWVAKYFWPTEENDRLICAVFWPQNADPADVARGRAMEHRNRLWHQRARVVVAPLALLAVLLACTRPRAFSFVLLPWWSYVLGLALTVFAGRYRVTSDPLMLVCLAALLVDLIWGSRETGRGLNRWAKLVLVVLAVSGSAMAYWRGWDAHWYALPPGPVPQPAFDPAQPNLVTLDLQRTDTAKAVSSGGCTARLAPESNALRVRLQSKPDATRPGGGLRLPVAGLRAVRLGLACDRPDQITSLIVRGLDAEGRNRLSWTWNVVSKLPTPAKPATFALVPAERSSYFVADIRDPDADGVHLVRVSQNRLARGAEVGELIRELRVVAILKPGAEVSLLLHELTLALPSAATAPPTRQWQALDWPAAEDLKLLATQACRVEPAFQAEGLELHLRGTPEAEGVQYGGVALPIPGSSTLRLRMSFDQPENVDAISVSGVDANGEAHLSWEYGFGDAGLRPVAGSVQDWLLVPGERSSGFVPVMSDTSAAVTHVRILVRIKPGTEASATLHSVETAPDSTSARAIIPPTSAPSAPADDEPDAPPGD